MTTIVRVHPGSGTIPALLPGRPSVNLEEISEQLDSGREAHGTSRKCDQMRLFPKNKLSWGASARGRLL